MGIKMGVAQLLCTSRGCDASRCLDAEIELWHFSSHIHTPICMNSRKVLRGAQKGTYLHVLKEPRVNGSLYRE